MKRLDELVLEEMQKKNIGARPVDVSRGISPEDVAFIVQNAQQRQQHASARIEQDPALAALILTSVQVFEMIAMLPAPPQAKKDGTIQFLVEVIEIWENANNRFNDQLKQKP